MKRAEYSIKCAHTKPKIVHTTKRNHFFVCFGHETTRDGNVSRKVAPEFLFFFQIDIMNI